jgi:RNA polymerase sigma-70 factor (ECF subfamily)
MRGGQGEEELPFDPPDTAPSPRQEAAGREQMEAFQRVLGQLSAEHREVLLLRFAENLSYEEIAETLQISLGTVKSRLSRAHAAMDRELSPVLHKHYLG